MRVPPAALRGELRGVSDLACCQGAGSQATSFMGPMYRPSTVMNRGYMGRFKAGVARPLGLCGSSEERLPTNSRLIALDHVPGDSYKVLMVLNTGQGHLACVKSQSGLPGVVVRARQLLLPPSEQEQGDTKENGSCRAKLRMSQAAAASTGECLTSHGRLNRIRVMRPNLCL